MYITFNTGVGTRGYYRKLGYELEGPYMTMGLDTDADEGVLMSDADLLDV